MWFCCFVDSRSQGVEDAVRNLVLVFLLITVVANAPMVLMLLRLHLDYCGARGQTKAVRCF